VVEDKEVLSDKVVNEVKRELVEVVDEDVVDDP
jgi:hypothetical protein